MATVAFIPDPGWEDELEHMTFTELRSVANTAAGLARAYAPVDTGRLQDSIRVVEETEGDERYVGVGSDVPYAIYPEFGTVNMDAQPYLRPAIAAAFSAAGMDVDYEEVPVETEGEGVT